MLLSHEFLAIDQFVHAICWTLAHSLWQGLVLALLAGGVLIATKKSSAALRYNLLVGSFSLFVTVIIFTFCSQWLSSSHPSGVTELLILSAGVTEHTVAVQMSPVTRIAGAINAFLNDQAFSIVCIWFLILMVRGIRLTVGLKNLQQTKTKHIFSTGEYWTSRVKTLAKEIGIQHTVRFFESGIAKVPAVLGHFKPVILFPAGLLSSLPPDEVEAILLHELAHIRRKDYLVNLLQNVVEICLFFNPGALWVSSLIKQERENCCDDIAVRKTGNKRNYINALLSFQEFNLGRQVYAPAIAGKKFQLLARVKRLINDNNKTMNAMEKFSLTAGLFVAGITALAFTTDLARQKVKSAQSSDLLKNEVVAGIINRSDDAALLSLISDTIPDRKKEEFWNKESANISSTIDGKKYRMVMKDGKITELYVDETRVADDKINDYKDVTGRVLKEAKENWERDMKMAELANREMQQSKGQSDREKKRQMNDERFLERLKMEEARAKDREFEEAAKGFKERELMAEKYQDMSEKERIVHERAEIYERILKLKSDYSRKLDRDEIELMEKLELLREKTVEQNKELSITNQNIETLETKRTMDEAIQLQNEARKAQQAAQELQLKAEISTIQAKQSQADAENILKGIIGDLLDEHVITDTKKLTFLLTDDELIVNGVKQPEGIHKKLKAKYFKEKGGSFNYNYKKKVQ